ncbi:hypothetical protein [Mesorhizobium amorphae]|nr:hypothetical protein [Mesorhizobium amorphae]
MVLLSSRRRIHNRIGWFESAGVEFIPENGGGAGVRLRKTDQAAV